MSKRTFFSTPFKSRLSQRMFAVFLFCAMLPILLITLISDLYVQQYLEWRISQELRSTSRVCETVVYDVLLLFENELKRFWETWPESRSLDELDLDNTKANSIGLYFTDLGRSINGGVSGHGGDADFQELTPKETHLLDRGKTLIRVVRGGSAGTSLLMIGRLNGVPYYGVTNAEYLQRRVSDYSAWGNIELAVLSESGRIIASSLSPNDLPELNKLDRRNSAIFDVTYSREGEEQIGVLKTLFLKGHFGGSNWTLMLIKPRADAFEPLKTFRRTLLLMMLIAIVTICLFMVVLIRRYTSHIGVLQEATEKIRNRDFDHRIDIKSGDEFEQLGEAFNMMTQSLRDYRHDLRKQAEELQQRVFEVREARKKERMLQDQLSRAERLDSLGQLAGGVAHDFNNLLMAIMGNADLALTDLPEDSPVRANIKGIESASKRAADLCRQMLVYAGRGSYDFELIDLSEVIRDVGDLMRVSISKDIELTYDVQKDLPPIFGDATQVLQIVLNFITNASAAIGQQVGEITVRTGSRICTNEELQETYLENDLQGGKYVYLQVSDTGCGMDQKTLARVFDPFYTTKDDGRGLGLAAVLGIIRAHQGTLTVKSQLGHGSTFTVYFPAQDPVDHQVIDKNRGPNQWQWNATMMVVDDEEAVREVAGNMLRRLGITVVLARSGTEAIEMLQSKQHEGMDAVLLDMRMPHMNGPETLGKLREICPTIPVILSSGNAKSKFSDLLDEHKFTEFVQKPYRIRALAVILERLLTSPRERSASPVENAPVE